MSAIVFSETLYTESATKQGFKVSNSNVVRPHGIADGDWTKLRFGVLCSLDGPTTSITSSPRLYLGFCQGQTNLPLTVSTDDFLGVMNVAATLTVGTMTFGHYWGGTSGLKYVQRSGTTDTVGTTAGTWIIGNDVAQSTNAFGPTMMFVDITKGSPNYTVQAFHRNAQLSVTGLTETEFLNQMSLSTPSFTRHTLMASEAIAASGTYDNVCIAWDRSVNLFRVNSMAVSRLA